MKHPRDRDVTVLVGDIERRVVEDELVHPRASGEQEAHDAQVA